MSGIYNASQAEVIRPIRGSFLTSQSNIVRLGRRIGIGGEGEVYEIQDSADLVAKIYHEPPPPEKAEKLVALSSLGNDRLFNLSAWPVDVLRETPGGDLAGFVMKKISGAEEVHTLHSPKSRLQKFPEASWSFLIYVAANIARAVAAVHEHGLVIGDLNPKNILVTRKATVYLLDVDSFQVSVDGRTYRCDGGFAEYTPPELQGVAFRDVDRTQEHDCFGLAVVIFQLLFMGRHPFSGRYLGAGEMPLERAIRESRFAYGADAEARKMRQPPGAPALDSLPSTIVDLFRRAFLSNDRPQPREWIEPLDALAKSLKKCVLHSGHHYYKELRECPWCGIETQSRVRLFNFPLPGDSQRGHFRLDEIWKAIESVEPPDTSMIPWHNMLKAPEPSAEVASLARNRRYRFVVSIWFSAIAGLAIPLLIGFPLAFSFFLLILAGCAAYAIGKPKRPVSVELIFQLRQPAPDPLLVELQAHRRQMEEAARQLQERYDLEAGNERWGAKRDELLNRKETYENLARIRDFKFEQLARKDQFDEFLDKFEVNHSDVAGIGEAAIASLISHGVETAADITEDRLGQIPSLNESRVRRLLRWRQELEQKFVFEPDRNITPQPRIAVEKEIDALRRQLELELSSGANYLTRVKQETETNIQRLLPALVNARQEVAQADKDLQVASKRYSFIPILAALIITFLIGMAIMPSHDMSPGTEVPPSIIPPGRPAPIIEKSAQEALKFYYLGVKLAREENYTEAVIAFRKAVEIDPKINGAYEDLGYALYRLKNYEESANASKEAIKLSSDFGPYYNLGLAYMALGYWDGASTAFEFAIAHRGNIPWEERHTLAYYYRGRSKTRLGEAKREIEKLESLLKAAPGLTVDRLELACLYLWVGRQKDARAQYEILKKSAPRLAEELMILIKKHESRPLAGVKPVIARGKKEHSWLTS